MSEIKLPDFMKGELKHTELGDAHEAYIKKFGRGKLATAGIDMSEGEWIEALNSCVRLGIEMDEYLGIGDINPEDEI